MVNRGELIFNKKWQKAQKNGQKNSNQQKSLAEEKQKLENLIRKSQRVLLEISTIFPFDFFPDKLIIDENKVNLINFEFFDSGRTHSVMIKDISDVLVDSGLIFAKLQIIDRGFVENSIELQYLSREDALKARRIIQGLIVAQNEGIDFSKIEKEELVQKIEELGKTQG